MFDAERSRKGYWLNQYCMSLMMAKAGEPMSYAACAEVRR
jgi:hypothetical protein